MPPKRSFDAFRELSLSDGPSTGVHSSPAYLQILSSCKTSLRKLLRPSVALALIPFIDHVRPYCLQRLSKQNLLALVDDLSFDTLHKLSSSLSAPIIQPAIQAAANDIHPTLPHESFMKPPSPDVIARSIANFSKATSNSAVKQEICVSCARELFAFEGESMLVQDIPNLHILEPHSPHPAHNLSSQGSLLYPRSYEDNENIFVCRTCLLRLRKSALPRLSLANNMWIGDVPHQLRHLTQPEKILIALYVPVAYVYKLYPKSGHGKKWASNKLHQGLRGNVSTYKLDQSGISNMLSGTMPNLPDILSSTIAISFVGPRNKVQHWLGQGLPSTFIVRRSRVAAALLWLKQNNPLWASITISEDRLSLLPENSVPDILMATTRESDDTSALDTEHASYIPEENDDTILVDDNESDNEDLGTEPLDLSDNDSEIDVDEYDNALVEPCVIPMQSLGVIDVAGASVTDTEIMAHALNNAAHQDNEHYAVKRGSEFINEYARLDPDTNLRNDGGPSNPNHLLGSFPVLFPYGMGGFEMGRPETVSYECHSQWALQYGDKRFRLDIHFIFQVFGVLQKRYICKSACLQMTTQSYTRNQALLNSLRPHDLIQASREELLKIPFSNPGVRALRKELKTIRTKVPATDENRAGVRSKIWGMNLIFNSPNLWITINPGDTQNPIAQVFIGDTEIDLDKFIKTAGPDSDQRAANIAKDPYASAKFFKFIITVIIETLFGFKKSGNGLNFRTEGILGLVNGYVGTVEAQGRGSLHLHLLVWLKGSLGPEQMKSALQSEEFRERIEAYISEVIHADIDDKTTDQILEIPKEKELGYSRPIDTFDPEFALKFKQRNRAFARSMQLHQCRSGACLVTKKGKGKPRCKRRSPWHVSRKAWIKPNGEWGPKRTSGKMNSWNPCIGHCAACNHDIKLITSGSYTKRLTWYITHYATKKQSGSSNTSALLARRLAFHRKSKMPMQSAVDANKRLLQGCANILSRDREISAPEVISYLMGWGDVYESHYFAPIHWYAAMSDLYTTFPELRDSELQPLDSTKLAASESGPLRKFEPIRDYNMRGVELEGTSLYDFFLNTYERSSKLSTINDTDPDNILEDQTATSMHPRGRPPHQRVSYLPAREKPHFCRMLRKDGHETVPRIIGPWFVRSDQPDKRELYCASMLMLLKPWRSIAELKTRITFEDTFAEFMSSHPAAAKLQILMDNIQYYYECADDANAHVDDDDSNDSAEHDDVSANMDVEPDVIDEESIRLAAQDATPERSRIFAARALDIAKSAGIFSSDISNKDQVPVYTPGQLGTPEHVKDAKEWDRVLKGATRQHNAPVDPNTCTNHAPNVRKNLWENQPEEPAVIPLLMSNNSLPSRTRDILLDDQRRAYDIIHDHLRAHLDGRNPPQLLLQVQGRGGTGKSLLIKAVTELFESLSCADLLSKSATSGIAASQIGGVTVHNLAGIPVGNPKTGTSDEVHERRRRNLALKLYGIIDESSMIDKRLLCKLSDVTCEARSRHGNGITHLPFGGMNVILFGDYHQFPPVGNSSGALYEPSKSSDHDESIRGKQIYDQFDKIVILTHQMRCPDIEWDHILARLREGECTEEDIDEVKKLVLTNPQCQQPNFDCAPWNAAVLVTSRHAVRKEWNKKALEKHCRLANQLKFIVHSRDEDTRTKAPASMHARYHLAAASNTDCNRKLENIVEFAIGMEAMVLQNIATEADLSNGTRGIIEDVIFHPDEPPHDIVNGAVTLKYLPIALLLRPRVPSDLLFKGIKAGLIPITPSSTGYNIPAVKKGEKGSRIKRTQFALTAAYAFTDYKAQGQTIEYVIIDIAKPPTGTISPFAIYVALSRSRGRSNIRLLRGFDDSAFRIHPSESLRVEMVRLRELDHIQKNLYLQQKSGMNLF